MTRPNSSGKKSILSINRTAFLIGAHVSIGLIAVALSARGSSAVDDAKHPSREPFSEMAASFVNHHGPPSVEILRNAYPELDGVLLSAAEHMEQERLNYKCLEGKREKNYDTVVQSGMQLAIHVEDEPELWNYATVDTSGRIDCPYLGLVEVKGKNLKGIETEIESGFRTIFCDADLHVCITLHSLLVDQHPEKIKVSFMLGDDWLSVWVPFERDLPGAITQIGGMPPHLEWRSVLILREDKEKDNRLIILVDYFACVAWRDLDQEVPLEHGDVVLVSQFMDWKSEQAILAWAAGDVSLDEMRGVPKRKATRAKRR